jgi:hypothetical protein
MLHRPCRPALVATKPPVRWVSRALSPGVKRPGAMKVITHLHLGPMLKGVEVCLHYPCAFVAGAGTSTAPFVVLYTLRGVVIYIIVHC